MAIHVGVMQMHLEVPGARSAKDRRQALKSLQDRIGHRFSVTWNEVAEATEHDRRRVVCTTAGSDPQALRSVFDTLRRFVEQSGRAWPLDVDVDIFPWKPHERRWADLTDTREEDHE